MLIKNKNYAHANRIAKIGNHLPLSFPGRLNIHIGKDKILRVERGVMNVLPRIFAKLCSSGIKDYAHANRIAKIGNHLPLSFPGRLNIHIGKDKILRVERGVMNVLPRIFAKLCSSRIKIMHMRTELPKSEITYPSHSLED